MFYKVLFGHIEDLIRDKKLIIAPSGPLTTGAFTALKANPVIGRAEALQQAMIDNHQERHSRRGASLKLGPLHRRWRGGKMTHQRFPFLLTKPAETG